MTGRLRPAPSAGVQTLSTRQSSLSAGRPAAATASGEAFRPAPGSRCGALGPYASASRTAVHLAGATGGMNLFLPAVLAPYGMPLKILIPATSVPRTRPYAVSAVTDEPSWAKTSAKPALDAAIRSPDSRRKSRRDRIVIM